MPRDTTIAERESAAMPIAGQSQSPRVTTAAAMPRATGAEREADAELASLPRDAKCNHAVDADRAERQRHRRRTSPTSVMFIQRWLSDRVTHSSIVRTS